MCVPVENSRCACVDPARASPQVTKNFFFARHRVRDWHCKGDGLEAVALTDAVLLTEVCVCVCVSQ